VLEYLEISGVFWKETNTNAFIVVTFCHPEPCAELVSVLFQGLIRL
jgi:hypothetical protein